MAFRCIIKIDGITGTSDLKDGWIDVTSFNWGVSNDVKAWEKSPSGTAHVQDFSVSKRVDPASPDIATYCANGKKIGTIEVSLVQSSGDANPKEFANYKFTTCYITSVHPSGSSDSGSDFGSEAVTWNFAKAEYGYGAKKGGFDIGKGGIQGQ
jgi:type VI secretion system secreted protein Hcp